MPFTVLTVFGTRPEAIKLWPVVRAVEADPDLRSRVLVTAQHRDMLDQHLARFGLTPDVDLDLMRPGHTLSELTVRVLESMDRALQADRPDVMLVQGDTTTVFAAALAAFYRGVPVGHVEAGLRSFDLANPFPEEANRRLTTQITALHFAPTKRAQAQLLAEQVPAERVVLTGNTVVDALQAVLQRPDLPPPPEAWQALPPDSVPVFVELHRRENWGEPLAAVCRALLRALEALPRMHVVFPVHPQPLVQETVLALLSSHPRVALIKPLDYLENVAAMRASCFILTDSGGIQEEAPVLGKPVLVARAVTERPEAIEAGTARLVGTDEETVLGALCELATDPSAHAAMAHAASPFGDGTASARIVAAIRHLAALPPIGEALPPL